MKPNKPTQSNDGDAKSSSTPTSTDTNTSFKNQLEDILDQYYAPIKLPDNNRTPLITSIINLIDKEVIGEDEYPDNHFPTYLGHKDSEVAKRYDEVTVRDRLRAKQRAIIRKS